MWLFLQLVKKNKRIEAVKETQQVVRKHVLVAENIFIEVSDFFMVKSFIDTFISWFYNK